MPGLHQIHREPRNKKVSQRSNTELPYIDSNQHSLTEQLLDSRPTKRTTGRLRSCHTIDIHQPTTSIDVFDLSLRDQRMVLHVVDRLRPHEGKQKSKQPHKPETASPAIGMSEPSKKRCKRHQREILRRIEDRRSPATLCRRKPRSNNASVAREDRRLCQAR